MAHTPRLVTPGTAPPRLLIFVPLAVLLTLLLAPLVAVTGQTLLENERHSLGDSLARLSQPLYRQVFLNTLLISLEVTLLTLILGYPVALLLARSPPRVERILLAFIVSSMYLSILIRSYAWIALLREGGPLAGATCGRSILYTRTAVVLGMTHVLLPYMTLSIWTSLKRQTTMLERAARSLGATRTYAFFRIVLPQSRAGIAAGILLVFLLSLGFYITPELLGGGQGDSMMVAVLVEQQWNELGNWRMGGVLSLSLVAMVLLLAVGAWSVRPIREIWRDLFSIGK